MDPNPITAGQWDQISRALIFLFLFTGLGLTSAMGFLIGGAMLPSLIASRDVASVLSPLRWIAYPVALLALALAGYALLRALLIAMPLAQEIYPRGWM